MLLLCSVTVLYLTLSLTWGSLSVVALSCRLFPGLCGALGSTVCLPLPPLDDDPPLVWYRVPRPLPRMSETVH